MTHHDDLEHRIAALESEMREVRVLATGAHEDAGDVKAILRNHTQLINGWGSQLNARLDTELGDVRGRLDNHEQKLDQILDLLRDR